MTPPTSSRLYFWDTARAVLVLLVAALHAAAAYCTVLPWWHVRNADTGPAFDLLLSALDGFLMPTLFFIAGAFAPASLARRGPGTFFRAKILRFVPTLLVFMVTLLPLMTYVGYVSRTPEPMGFPAYLRPGWHRRDGPCTLHTVANGMAARPHLQPYLWFLCPRGAFRRVRMWRTDSRQSPLPRPGRNTPAGKGVRPGRWYRRPCEWPGLRLRGPVHARRRLVKARPGFGATHAAAPVRGLFRPGRGGGRTRGARPMPGPRGLWLAVASFPWRPCSRPIRP
jgi:hypothetical protein